MELVYNAEGYLVRCSHGTDVSQGDCGACEWDAEAGLRDAENGVGRYEVFDPEASWDAAECEEVYSSNGKHVYEPYR